jgi:hypothetical protein
VSWLQVSTSRWRTFSPVASVPRVMAPGSGADRERNRRHRRCRGFVAAR